MSEAATPDAPRIFKVRFGPDDLSAFGGKWPNNIDLVGSGTLELSAGGVLFSDGHDVAPAQRRTFAMADIANVGQAQDATGSIVAVRTSAGDREVLVWMASPEEARTLLGQLPTATTPEFLAHQEQHRKFRDNLAQLAPRAPVTPTIIGINVAVFLLLVAAGAGIMQTSGVVELHFGSDYGPLTWGGQPWRLITAAFIHFGLIHLGFNMYALYNGGVTTERLFGSARFAVIYLLAALSGNVVSGWWDATRNSAGASGAVFGVYGALLVFFWRRPADIPRDILKSVRGGAISLCVYSLAMGAVMPIVSLTTGAVMPIVDNAAHVGGLLGGALAGLLLVRPFEPAARSTPQPWRIVATAIGICGALAALAAPLLMNGVPGNGMR